MIPPSFNLFGAHKHNPKELFSSLYTQEHQQEHQNFMGECLLHRLFLTLLALLVSVSGTLRPSEGSEQKQKIPTKIPQGTYGLSLHEDLKYKPDQPFQDANPEAPKGGALRLEVVGTFNSLNPYLLKGIAPEGLSLFGERLVFESLLKRSPDEPFSLYANIAERVAVAPDRSWIIFHLNPKARWADGKPIHAEDVLFSFEIQRDKGKPNLQLFYGRVARAEILGPRTIKFTFKPPEDGTGYDRELPFLMGILNILPKHFFKTRAFETFTLEPLMGSGPYSIAEVQPGRSITYRRRPDYWGKDLPVNRGCYNFDIIQVDYFRDSHVALEAFKVGHHDLRRETNPTVWQTGYHVSPKRAQQITFLEMPHHQPVGVFSAIFNTRRPLFKDPKIREALSYAFDFEWVNQNLYRQAYRRLASYFENTELASHGTLPQGKELDLLRRFKNRLPTQVFTQLFSLPIGGNLAKLRHNLKTADRLLRQAGWSVNAQGQRVHHKTGQPFKFEMLLQEAIHEKLALSFAQNLKKLGIQMIISTLDPAQFESRRLQFDFDMILQLCWGGTRSPGKEQSFYFHSSYSNQTGSRNYPGIEDPVVDFLCDQIAQAKNRKDLIAAARALDRVLLWGHYVILLYYHNQYYIAYDHTRLDHPPLHPECPVRLSTWWSKHPLSTVKRQTQQKG